IWALTVVALLALPLLSLLLPRWDLPFPAPWSEQVGEEPPANMTATPGAHEVLVPHTRHFLHHQAPRPILVAAEGQAPPWALRAAAVRIAVVPSPPAVERSSSAWLLIIWGGGAALAVAWILSGCLSLHLLRRQSRPLTEGPAAAMLAELTAALGIRRRVRLLESDRRAIPMTWGWWRPVVLLPAEAATWSAERLRHVLLHELGHVRRWDCVTQMLAHCMRGLYWFHPLAWLAVGRLKAEQEAASDDVVLRSGAGAADYAEHLLAVATGLPARSLGSPAALAMARVSKLRRRVVALLDAQRSRRPLHLRRAALAAFVGTALL